MQLNYVYLYRNQLDIFTNYNQSGTQERYRRVYNRNIKIYPSVDNTIDFTVRNSSQKEISLGANTVLVFNLISNATEDLIVQKDCSVLDVTRGRYQVTLSEQELFDIESGFYKFTLVAETRTNVDSTTYDVTSKQILYTDDQYGSESTLEVLGGATGKILPSVEVTKFNRVDPAATGDEELPYFESTIIDGKRHLTQPNGLHTFQFYFSNYTGRVVIEGSLDEGGAPHNWTALDEEQYTDQIDNTFKNINGKYRWFRIVHTPNDTGAQAVFVITQTVFGNYLVSIRDGGVGYDIGNTITINGSDLGGEDTTNDLTITIAETDEDGAITEIDFTGTSYNGVRKFVKSGPATSIGTVDKILYR